MNPWMQWVIGGVVLLVVEMLTPGAFFFACFAIAAFIAAATQYYLGIWWLNWIVFAVSALALILLARPLTKSLLKGDERPSNVDELIGKLALVQEQIAPHQLGTVKVGSEVWRAQADHVIEQGKEVIVKGVDGTRLIVELRR